MSRMSPSLAAASSSFSTPSARHMRRSVPNWLMRSGCFEPSLLEEQRRPARLDDAIGDLGDLEVGVDLGGDALQLALALEERDPLAEVSRRRHAVSLRRRARTATAHSDDSPRPSAYAAVVPLPPATGPHFNSLLVVRRRTQLLEEGVAAPSSVAARGRRVPPRQPQRPPGTRQRGEVSGAHRRAARASTHRAALLEPHTGRPIRALARL